MNPRYVISTLASLHHFPPRDHQSAVEFRLRRSFPIIHSDRTAPNARGTRADLNTMLFGLFRIPAVLLVLAGLLLTAPAAIEAIEAKCSACAAVAGRLQTALEAEKPRNHVDLRGRLDSKGVRYGKLIPYDVSEQRFTELMEDVCGGSLGQYQLKRVKLRDGPEDGDGIKVTQRWENIGRVSKNPQAKTMRDELNDYCHRIVEKQEEVLQKALYAKELNSTNVAEKMCIQFGAECEDGDDLASAQSPAVKEAKLEKDKDVKSSGKKKKGAKKKGAKKPAKGDDKKEL